MRKRVGGRGEGVGGGRSGAGCQHHRSGGHYFGHQINCFPGDIVNGSVTIFDDEAIADHKLLLRLAAHVCVTGSNVTENGMRMLLSPTNGGDRGCDCGDDGAGRIVRSSMMQHAKESARAK
jgi:hypothetical protein